MKQLLPQKLNRACPERGRFLMIYTYQGQSIEPDISVTLNGETIASLNQLTPVTWTTLVDLETEKGDQAVLAHFMDDGGSIALHNSFGSLTQGYWTNQFDINFYLRDEDGNFVEHLGTMSIAFYLFPPFEGFVIDADPTKIAPGEESRVHFESVELPDEPVIVPGNTAVDFRLSSNGWRLGGYALPMLDAENLSAIVNMPYAFMANTPIYYRTDPDSTLLEGTSETVHLGVFSHFNTSIAGQTDVEVSLTEDELTMELEITGANEIWPTIPAHGVQSSFDLTLIENSTEFIITVDSGGEPKRNQLVEITAEWKPDSGGHNHNGSQGLKVPKPELVGLFTNLSTEESSQGVISAITDSMGTIRLNYESPKFGGEVDLRALITDGEETTSSSQHLTLRVPDLMLLPDAPHLYEKIGGVPNHHGPRIDNRHPNHRTPDNNHWVNETAGQLFNRTGCYLQ